MPRKNTIPCSIQDCDDPSHARGWCKKHYHRWTRHGDPSTTLIPSRGKVACYVENLLSLAKYPDECILWPFSVAGGYGAISWSGHMDRAHRVICRLVHGNPASDSLEAAHRCGVKACVNPTHIRWATRSENEQDKVMHGKVARGSIQGLAKLTEEDVMTIRDRLSSGETGRSLAAEYGVSASAVSHIKIRATWAWLKESEQRKNKDLPLQGSGR